MKPDNIQSISEDIFKAVFTSIGSNLKSNTWAKFWRPTQRLERLQSTQVLTAFQSLPCTKVNQVLVLEVLAYLGEVKFTAPDLSGQELLDWLCKDNKLISDSLVNALSSNGLDPYAFIQKQVRGEFKDKLTDIVLSAIEDTEDKKHD